MLVASFTEGYLKPQNCIDGYLADEWNVTDVYGCWYVAQWQHDDYSDYPYSVDLHFDGSSYIVSKQTGSAGQSMSFDNREAAERQFKQWVEFLT